MKWERARRPEQKRARIAAILAAAAALFETQEFDRVSMSAIAAGAGLGKASLYHYFHTKEELFLALCLEDIEHWAAEVEHRLDQLRRPNAARIAACLTASLRNQTRLLRLHAVARSVLERNATQGAVAEFRRSAHVQTAQVASALRRACPELTLADVAEFLVQHQAIISGLWTIAHPAREIEVVDKLPEFQHLRVEFFSFYERMIVRILQGMLEECRRRQKSGQSLAC